MIVFKVNFSRKFLVDNFQHLSFFYYFFFSLFFSPNIFFLFILSVLNFSVYTSNKSTLIESTNQVNVLLFNGLNKVPGWFLKESNQIKITISRFLRWQIWMRIYSIFSQFLRVNIYLNLFEFVSIYVSTLTLHRVYFSITTRLKDKLQKRYDLR
jgi:hypothetical protein